MHFEFCKASVKAAVVILAIAHLLTGNAVALAGDRILAQGNNSEPQPGYVPPNNGGPDYSQGSGTRLQQGGDRGSGRAEPPVR